MFTEMRADRHYKPRTESFDALKCSLLEKAQEDWIYRALQKGVSLNTLQEYTPSPDGDMEMALVSCPQAQTQRPQSRGKGKGKGKGGSGKGGSSSGVKVFSGS